MGSEFSRLLSKQDQLAPIAFMKHVLMEVSPAAAFNIALHLTDEALTHCPVGRDKQEHLVALGWMLSNPPPYVKDRNAWDATARNIIKRSYDEMPASEAFSALYEVLQWAIKRCSTGEPE